MKNSIKTFAILFIILAFASCMTSKKASDAVVTPLSGNAGPGNGSIVYALPRTVFNVSVKMERTIDIPGPYWKYAGDLLGLTNVIQNYNELWAIKGISVESAEEIDPSQYYVIAGSSVAGSSMLSMRKEGLILDINPAMYYGEGNITGSESNETGRFRQSDLGSDEYFSVQRDTAYKRVSVDSTFIRLPYVVEKRRRLPDEQLAERAAKRLMEMRDGKHLILTGVANVFPQSDAAINEMNRMEREYTELFAGKTMKQERTYTFQVIPTEAVAGKPVNVFSFSEATGISDNQQGGEPVYIELTPEKKTSSLAALRSNADNREDQSGYLYYRMPDVVNMKIRLGDEVLFNSRRLVYQYGEILRLPGNFILAK
jgi:hypothetical protein